MSVIFVFLFVVALFVVMAAVSSCFSAPRNELKHAAHQLGFRCDSVASKIEGTREDLKISIYPTASVNTQSSHNVLRYRIRFPFPLNLGLRLYRQDYLKYLSHRFGCMDIETGDSDFDDHLVIQGHDPQEIRSFLTRDRKALILEILEKHPIMILDDHELVIEGPGDVSAETIVETVLQAACRVQRILPEKIKRNAVPEVMPRPERVMRAKPAPTSRTTQLQIVVPDETASREPISEIESIQVQTEELPVQEFMVQDVQKSQLQHEDVETMPTENHSQNETGIQAFCDDLFADERSSGEFAKTVGELKGTDIVCMGRFNSCQHFSYDRRFDAQTGYRAVFEIHQMKRRYGSRSLVKAVALVPEGVARRLMSGPKGTQFMITGTFLDADSLRHEIYLTDGYATKTAPMRRSA